MMLRKIPLRESALALGLVFSVVTASAAGRQLTGPHAPSSSPALSAADEAGSFTLHDGFEIRLFAAEPDVINPVAMSWDARGRLWVLELFEYPLGAKDGEKGRDRIRILEDTDADGRADKVTLFADGLSLATGLVWGDGGVYVGQAPHMLFLKDTDGDDRADTREILLTGFGLEDRHELLNGFNWGPDGWLYFTQGVFTHSLVRKPGEPESAGVKLDAGVARYHPKTRRFEVFADGVSNQWGVDFDAAGNAFVSACVIDHLFHMMPGGIYVRQAGQSIFPYAYEQLPSIVDHRHYRAAYCGVQVYLGNQYPDAFTGKVLMGNIHANAVNMDRLERRGSGFHAEPEKDFVVSSDGWFRAISQKVGPDGAVWIGDWYDRYPCYQNAMADPEGVDREYGRIWRVVHTGDRPGRAVPSRPSRDMNIAALSSEKLADLLGHENIWQRKMARKLLSERGAGAFKQTLHQGTPVHDLFESSDDDVNTRLNALWTLHDMGVLDEEWVDRAAEDPAPAIRAWAARLTGERGYALGSALDRLDALASDDDPSVRLAVAVAARQLVSGSLTVDTPPAIPVREVVTGSVLTELIKSSHDSRDPLIDFMYWMAVEPIIDFDPVHVLGFFSDDGMKFLPLSAKLMTKILRRTGEHRDPELLGECLAELSGIPTDDVPILIAALDGLLATQRGGVLRPDSNADTFLKPLLVHRDGGVRDRALRLGALWRNEDAMREVLQIVGDEKAPADARVAALDIAKQLPAARNAAALRGVLRDSKGTKVLVAAINAMDAARDDSLVDDLINRWSGIPASARRAAIGSMSSRESWTFRMLDAIEAGTIDSGEIPATVLRNLSKSDNAQLRERVERTIGKFRDSGTNVEQLIAMKKRVVLSGEPDLANGRRMAEAVCLVCHTLHGKGAAVGPDLTGVGRSTLDALLANVINPNQIIGAGYENVVVETKDDRTISGRLAEETPAQVRMLMAGPVEQIVPRSEIASITRSDVSVMPEGLERLPDADFRDLIWYVLIPPEDNRGMTDALWKELVGEEPPPAKDWESVALWNPDWNVESAEWGDAPAKLPVFAGRKNVLMTHPFWHQRGAALESEVEVPADGRAHIEAEVAAREGGRWMLRGFVDGRLITREMIGGNDPGWRTVKVDLSQFAGQKVKVRLENYAFNLENDYGCWAGVKVVRE